jgi:lysozyme family protein
MTPFETWCDFLAPTEGGLSLDPNDQGNYTPAGKLVGTKFGISAHAYPSLDIPNLTIEQADGLRKTDYWDRVRGDELPGPIAFVLAEAAYGSGPGEAIHQLQEVVGVQQDMAFGPNTMRALMSQDVAGFVIEYSSQRMLFLTSLGTWDTYKIGWTRRLFHGITVALGFSLAPASVASVLLGEGTWSVTVKRAA